MFGVIGRWGILISLIAQMNSCASGSDTNDSAPIRPTQVLSGLASLAPIRGASVTVYDLDHVKPDADLGQWRAGEAIARGQTDENGQFQLDFQHKTTSCLIVVESGRYIEPVSQREIELQKDQGLYAIDHCLSGQASNVSLTWLSSFAFGYAVFLHRSGLPLSTAIDRAHQAIGDYVGFDIRQTIPVDVSDSSHTSASLTPELIYGFLSTSISQLTQWISRRAFPDQVAHSQIHSVGFIQTLLADIAFDGILNGVDVDGQIQIGRIDIDEDIYHKRLADALLDVYINPAINQTVQLNTVNAINNPSAYQPDENLRHLHSMAKKLVEPQEFFHAPPPSLQYLLPEIEMISLQEDDLVSGLVEWQTQVRHNLPVQMQVYINDVLVESSDWLADETITHWNLDLADWPQGEATVNFVARDAYGQASQLRRRIQINHADLRITRVQPASLSIAKDRFAVEVALESGLAEIEAVILREKGKPANEIQAQQLSTGSYRAWLDTRHYPDGQVSFEYIARDSQGRQAARTFVYLIDNTAPDIRLPTLEEGSWFTENLSLEFAVIEQNLNSLHVQLSDRLQTLNDLAKNADRYASEFSLAELLPGTYRVLITATDKAGHRTQGGLSVNIDQQAPILEFTGQARQVDHEITLTGQIIESYLDSAQLSLGQDEPLNWSIDRAGSFSITLDTRQLELADGRYPVSLSAQDQAGNHSEIQIEIDVDNTAPLLELVVPEGQFHTSIELSGSITDVALAQASLCIGEGQPLVNHQDCRLLIVLYDEATNLLDENSEFTQAISLDDPKILEGINYLSLRAIDRSGNETLSALLQSSQPEQQTIWVSQAYFIVDRVAPQLDLNVAPSWYGSTTGQIWTTVVERNLELAYLCLGVDLNAQPNCPAEQQIPVQVGARQMHALSLKPLPIGLEQGENLVSLYARDQAGLSRVHVSPTPLRLDTIAPDLQVSWPTGVQRGEISIDLTIGEVNLAQVGLAVYPSDDSEATEASHSQSIALESLQPNPSLGTHTGTVKLDSEDLADGRYRWQVYAIDLAGNRTQVNRSTSLAEGTSPQELSIDNSQPVVKITTTAQDLTVKPFGYVRENLSLAILIRDDNLQSARLSFYSSSDSIQANPIHSADLASLLDANGRASYTIDLTGADEERSLPEGGLYYALVAADATGHQTHYRLDFIVDTFAPVAHIRLPSPYLTDSVTVQIDIDEPNLSFAQFSLGNLLFDPQTPLHHGTNEITLATDSLTEGAHTFLVSLLDRAGQQTTVQTAQTATEQTISSIIVDNLDPQWSLAPPPTHIQGQLNLRGSLTEANPAAAVLQLISATGEIVAEYDLMTQLATPPTYTIELAIDTRPFADGEYRLRALVRDQVGRKLDLALIAHQPATIQIDNAVPIIQFDLPQQAQKDAFSITIGIVESHLKSAELIWPACRADASSLYSDRTDLLNISLAQVEDGAWQVSEDLAHNRILCLADGHHRLTVQTQDRSGHVTTIERSFQRDTQSPQLIPLLQTHDAVANHRFGQIRFAVVVQDDSPVVLSVFVADAQQADACVGQQLYEAEAVNSDVHWVDFDGSTHDEAQYKFCFKAIDEAGHLTQTQRWRWLTDPQAAEQSIEQLRQLTQTEDSSLVFDNVLPRLALRVPVDWVAGYTDISAQIDDSHPHQVEIKIFDQQAGLQYQHAYLIADPDLSQTRIDTRELDDGIYTVELLLTESNGRQTRIRTNHNLNDQGKLDFNSPSSPQAQLRVDNTTPVLQLNPIQNEQHLPRNLVQGTTTITGSVQEKNLASVSIYLNSTEQPAIGTFSQPNNFNYRFDSTHHPDGASQLIAVGLDEAGNRMQTSIPIVIDNTEARATIRPTGETYHRGSATIRYVIKEANLKSSTLIIDDRSIPLNLGGSSTTIDTREFTDGQHRLQIRTVDGFNQAKTFTMSGSLNIDNTATSIELVVPEGHFHASIELSGSVVDTALAQASLCIGEGEPLVNHQGCRLLVVLYDEETNLLDENSEFTQAISLDDPKILEGINYLSLRAIDRSGNETLSPLVRQPGQQTTWVSQVYFIVDRVAPQLDLNAALSWHGPTTGQIWTTVTESNLELAYLCLGVDLSVQPNCPAEQQIPIQVGARQMHILSLKPLPTGLEQGENLISLYARDQAGLSRVYVSPTPFKIDTIAPNLQVSWPEGIQRGEISIGLTIGEVNLAQVGLAVYPSDDPEATEAIHSQNIALESLRTNQSTHTGTVKLDSEDLDDGQYRWQVYAVDLAGNRTQVNRSTSLKGDTSPQTLSIDNSQPTVEITTTTQDLTVEAFGYVRENLNLAILIRDANLQSAQLSFYSSSDSIQANPIHSADLIPMLDANGRTSYDIDLTAPLAKRTLPEGGLYYELVATDTAGNRTRYRLDFVVDTLAPVARIRLPSLYLTDSVTVQIDIDEPNLSFAQFSLGNLLFDRQTRLHHGTNEITIDTDSLTEGAHTFLVSLLDRAGQQTTVQTAQTATEQTISSIIVDNLDPQWVLNPPPTYVQGRLNLRGSLTEANPATATLQLISATDEVVATYDLMAQLTTPPTHTIELAIDSQRFADGEYRLKALVQDHVDQQLDPSLSAHQPTTIQIDNTAPIIQLELPQQAQRGAFAITIEIAEIHLESAELIWPACRADASSLYSDRTDLLNTALAQAEDGTWQVSEDLAHNRILCLADGRHRLTVQARDRNGQVTTIERSFQRDTQSPQLIPLLQTHNAIPNHRSGQIRFAVSLQDDNLANLSVFVADASQKDACAGQQLYEAEATDSSVHWIDFDGSAHDEAQYKFCFKAIDEAGNLTQTQRWHWLTDPQDTEQSIEQLRQLPQAEDSSLVFDNVLPRLALRVPVDWVAGYTDISAQIDDSHPHQVEIKIFDQQAGLQYQRAYAISVPDLSQTRVDTRELDDGIYTVELLLTESNSRQTRIKTNHNLNNQGELDFDSLSSPQAQLRVDNTAPALQVNPIQNEQYLPNNLVKGTTIITGSVQEKNLASVSIYLNSTEQPAIGMFSRPNNFNYRFDSARHSDGASQLIVVGLDEAGNRTQTSIPIVIDNTEAHVTIQATGTTYYRGSVTIRYVITEANLKSSTLIIADRSIPLKLGSSSATIDTREFTDGQHRLQIRTVDGFNRAKTFAMSGSLNIDNTATAIYLIVPDGHFHASIELSGSVTDATLAQASLCIGEGEPLVNHQDCRLLVVLYDGETNLLNEAGEFTQTISLADPKILEGINYLSLRAIDRSGNETLSPLVRHPEQQETWVSQVYFIVDRVAPQLGLDVASSWHGPTTGQLWTTVTENNLELAYLCLGVDLNAQPNCPAEQQIPVQVGARQIHTLSFKPLPTGLEQGENLISLYARDQAGLSRVHVSPTPLKIDTIAPALQVSWPTGVQRGVISIGLNIGEVNLAQVGLAVYPSDDPEATEAIHSQSIALESLRANQSTHTGTVQLDSEDLADGQYRWQVYAVDLAGNRTQVNRSTALAEGTSPQTLYIDNSQPVVEITTTTQDITVEAFGYVRENLNLAILIRDDNLQSAQLSFYSSSASTQANPIHSTNLIALLNANGRASYDIDLTVPLAKRILPEGGLYYELVATDTAGNRTRYRLDFIVDTLAPVARIRLPSPYLTDSITVQIDIDEPNLSFAQFSLGNLMIDQQTPLRHGTNEITLDTRPLTEGSHTFLVSLLDHAGHQTTVQTAQTSAKQTISSIIVDNLNPKWSLTPPPTYVQGQLNLRGSLTEANPATAVLQLISATNEIVATYDLITQLTAPTKHTIELTINSQRFADGEYRLKALVRDRAGRQLNPALTAHQPATIQIDNATPIIQFELPQQAQKGTFAITIEIAESHLESAELIWPACRAGVPSLYSNRTDLLNTVLVQAEAGTWRIKEDLAHNRILCLADGHHRLTVQARDRSGHTTTIERSFQRDTRSPQLIPLLQIHDVVANHRFGQIRFAAVVQDDSPVDLSVFVVDARQTNACAGRQLYEAEATDSSVHWIDFDGSVHDEAQYKFCFKAIDEAGNLTQTQRWRWMTNPQDAEQPIEQLHRLTPATNPILLFDNVLPKLALRVPVDWVAGDANILFRIDDSHPHRAELRVFDNQARLQYKYSYTPRARTTLHHRIDTRKLNYGIYDIELLLTESNGRQTRIKTNHNLTNQGELDFDSPSSVQAKLRVDNLVPGIQINPISNRQYLPRNLVKGTIQITGLVREANIVSINIYLNSTNRSAIGTFSHQGPFNYSFNSTRYSDGASQLIFVGLDEAGNRTQASTTIVIDNTSTRATIQQTGTSYYQGLATIRYAITEANLKSLTLILNNQSLPLNIRSSSTTIDTRKFSDGQHRLQIRTIDGFNQPKIFTMSGTLNIDNTAPVIASYEILSGVWPISSPTVNRKIDLAHPATLKFNLESRDTHSGLSSFTTINFRLASIHNPQKEIHHVVNCTSTRTRSRCIDTTGVALRTLVTQLNIQTSETWLCLGSLKRIPNDGGLLVTATITDRVGNRARFSRRILALPDIYGFAVLNAEQSREAGC